MDQRPAVRAGRILPGRIHSVADDATLPTSPIVAFNILPPNEKADHTYTMTVGVGGDWVYDNVRVTYAPVPETSAAAMGWFPWWSGSAAVRGDEGAVEEGLRNIITATGY